ncbi:MAG: acyl-CoA dehydrogenase [Propionibacteriales bacterium]|nr:acyl-CoA dehydrogenase [Propionibacteriales bacterium]
MDFEFTPEQKALRESASRLARDKFAATAFTHDDFPWANLAALAEAGFTGLTIPEEFGGQGASLLDALLVMEAVSEVCPHSGDAVQATNFGAIRQIATFGSDDLRRDLLPRLIAGEGLVSAGMSEPGAGSALTELKTRAEIDGDHVVLNGQKVWNSHGPEATHVVVWCRFGPSSRDIGAVVVPTDTPGFTKGAPERYMSGERHCALFLDNVRVPRTHVLAERDGLSRMMTIFGIERMGNAVRSLALAQSAFDRAVEHAKTRQQFGRDLCEFQGIQWKFADMKVQLDAARLLVYRAVVNAGDGAPLRAEAQIAKLHANETAFKVANDALQVFGAAGYSTEYPMEYLVRRTRGWMIAGGSVEMMRNKIAESIFDRRFSQRATRATA